MRRVTDGKLGSAGTHKLIQFLSVFIDHENWHLRGPRKHTLTMGIVDRRTDAGLLDDFDLVVDVYFVEFDGRGRGVLREILKDRADSAAWATPGRQEINNHGFIPVYLILQNE
jgi:hypothetical protein